VSESATAVVREQAVEREDRLPRYHLRDLFDDEILAGITVRPADLGLAGRTATADVVESWLRLSCIDPGIQGVVVSRQIHGAGIVLHPRTVPGIVILDGYDGHVTASKGQLLAVTVADCVPVYLCAPGRAVSLLHAGWRGIAANGLEAAVDQLTQASGVGARDIRIHLGVAICGECYEVGAEVPKALGVHPGRTVDLRAVLADRARRLGVRQVTTSSWCSRHDNVFHSYRRDGVSAGRMVAYLGRRSLDSS
jgi:copper oxidase (laccase) domain-containing protein